MKYFKKKCVLAAISILLINSLSSLPMPALADDGTIKIAGQPVFSIISAADAGSLAKRADTIQNNLDNALVAAQDRTPAAVNITYVKGIPVITLGGYQVVTVSTQDATAAHTTPALLANQWADTIRGALVNQASVNSYVAQLSGNYALSAPAVNTVPAAGGAAGAAIASAAPSSLTNNYANPSNRWTTGGQTGANQSNLAAGNYPPPAGGSQSYESYNNSPNYNNTGNYAGQPSAGYRQGHVVYAPAGQIIPITLKTSIATQVAKAGDLIEGSISQNINLGESSIPAGTTVTGQVSSAKAGGRFTKSGELQIKFTQLQLPDGSQVPISAHIVGGIGKYAAGKQPDQVEGETWKNKLGSVAFRGLLGAGGGAALGTGIGAIAGGGSGAGAGAWSGAAIGSGVGVADSLILRKGKDVTVPSGTNIQLQLDQPVSISIGMSPGYNNSGGFNSGGPGMSGNYNVGSYTGGPNNVGYGGAPNGGSYGNVSNGNGYSGGSGGNYNNAPSGGSYNSGSGGNYSGGAGGGYNGSGYAGSGYSPQQQYNPPPLR